MMARSCDMLPNSQNLQGVYRPVSNLSSLSVRLWCSQPQHCTELWCWDGSSCSLWYDIARQGNFQQPLVVITKVKRWPVSLLSLLLDTISLSHWIWAIAGHCKLCVGKCETAADSSGSVPKVHLEMTSEQRYWKWYQTSQAYNTELLAASEIALLRQDSSKVRREDGTRDFLYTWGMVQCS